MPQLPEAGAAGIPDCPLFRNNVGRAPIGARDQRAQRISAATFIRGEGPWRRMWLLCGKIAPHHKARQERHEKLPDEPTLDDLALGGFR
jgi:hypothetical protein